MLQRIKKHAAFLIMCMICFIPRIILATQSLPFRTRADEMGTLAIAAYMSGNDWSSIISQTSYYGFGATIFLSPLFKILSNPLIIYKCMIGIWGILQGCIGCIAWHCAYRYFGIKNKLVLLLMSVIASYSVVTRNTAMFNETPLILITWLLVWCILYLHYNQNVKSKKYAASFLLTLLLMYSLTLHTRAITFFIGVLIVGIAYFVVERKTLYSIPIFVGTTALGYLIVKIIIKTVQNNIWDSGERSYITNTQIAVNGLDIIFQPESWQAWFNIVLGQINTLSMISGTLIVLALVWICKEFMQILKNRFVVIDTKIPFLCILSFATVCILTTILGQSFSEWLEYSVTAMKSGMDNSAYGLKAFTYVRYVGPYIGILVWGILIFLVKYTDNIRKILYSTIIVTLVIHVYWLVCVLPYIYHNQTTNETFLPFGLINNIEDPTRLRTYLAGTLVIILWVVLLWITVKYKKKVIFLTAYSLFLLYQYYYCAYYQDIYLMRQSYAEVEDTYCALNILDSEKLLSEKIGIYDDINTSHMTWYVYQFLFYDREVINLKNNPDELNTNDIIITNTPTQYKEFLSNGYSGVLVDEEYSSYILTKNPNVIEVLNSNGYSINI